MNTTVIPRLVVRDTDAAVAFYARALGAVPGTRHTAPDGTVVHAEVRVGSTLLTLKDEDHADRSPLTLQGTSVLLMLDVPDADAAGEALRTAGAATVFEISDMPYGYRQGRFTDPFGHQWIINQAIADLSPEEAQRRLDDMYGSGDG
ncbi:MAG: VOC family protein [Actinomycetota bacterium]|nr:VOC family protein [Actinomycetota bacterium]